MRDTGRVVWGVGFIAAAAFIVLSQLGLISKEFNIWTIAVAFLCVALFVSGVAKRSFGAIFFSIGMAWMSFGQLIGLPKVELWTMILIVVFLSIGFGMIFPKKHRANREDKWEAYENENEVGEYQKVKEYEQNGYVDCANTFGSLAKYINSPDFRGGRFSNAFGELKIYLDQAKICNGPVNVEVANSFGSVELYIPREWTVVQDVSVFAGNCVEKNRSLGVDGPIVNVTGNVSFGEVSIIYV